MKNYYRSTAVFSLGAWIGLVALKAILAGVIFSHLESKNIAGVVNSLVLSTAHYTEWACALLFVIAMFVQKSERKIVLYLSCLMLVLLVVYSIGVFGWMESLRPTINFDTPRLTDPSEARHAFNWGHRIYGALSLMNFFVGITIFSMLAKNNES